MLGETANLRSPTLRIPASEDVGGCQIDELIKVPWLTYSSGERRDIIAEAPPRVFRRGTPNKSNLSNACRNWDTGREVLTLKLQVVPSEPFQGASFS
jgi:hypothetical protein